MVIIFIRSSSDTARAILGLRIGKPDLGGLFVG